MALLAAQPGDARRGRARRQSLAGDHLSDHPEDARERTLAEIIRREGQSAFKTKLLRAYNGCCAVTACDELGALEAAHIHPYQGPDWNKVQNGLLLRGDIHTLFDRHLLGIDPQTRMVVLSLRLSGEHYRALDGHPVADPAEEGQASISGGA